MMSLMAGLMAGYEDLEPLRQVFEAIDIDHDGTLTKEEIAEMANKYVDHDEDDIKDASWVNLSKVLGPREGWVQKLMAVDLDGNGVIDYHEFIAATLSANKLSEDMVK